MPVVSGVVCIMGGGVLLAGGGGGGDVCSDLGGWGSGVGGGGGGHWSVVLCASLVFLKLAQARNNHQIELSSGDMRRLPQALATFFPASERGAGWGGHWPKADPTCGHHFDPIFGVVLF